MFGRKKDKIEGRVSKGMALLDRARPGWYRNINLNRLNISDGRACALGQVYGGYTEGSFRLGLDHRSVREHGFQISMTTLPLVGWEREYAALTEEWKRQIETRLDAEREQWAKDLRVTGRRHRLLTRR